MRSTYGFSLCTRRLGLEENTKVDHSVEKLIATVFEIQRMSCLQIFQISHAIFIYLNEFYAQTAAETFFKEILLPW